MRQVQRVRVSDRVPVSASVSAESPGLELGALSIALSARHASTVVWCARVRARLAGHLVSVGELTTLPGPYLLPESPILLAVAGAPGAVEWVVELTPQTPGLGDEEVDFIVEAGVGGGLAGLIPMHRYAQVVGARRRVLLGTLIAGAALVATVPLGSRLVSWSIWWEGADALAYFQVGSSSMPLSAAGELRGELGAPGPISILSRLGSGGRGGYQLVIEE